MQVIIVDVAFVAIVLLSIKLECRCSLIGKTIAILGMATAGDLLHRSC